MSNRDISYVKLLTEDSSFQLVRTNPKLTGNIKITINESDKMWLESIKANPELSKDLYSKVPIDTNQSHPANVFRFLNSGSTPNEIVFDLTEQVDSTKTSKNFKDQYDFSHYFSGAKYLASNKYTERMAYFAPLYLKRDVPDYFIIFKIENPANFPLDQIKQKYEAGQSSTDYLIDLFNNASIIKTFDLRAETSVGKYLRDYINNVNFPTGPLTVSYGENDFTTWNGIVINEGIFGSRGELLDSLYSASQPLKFFEENITNGFSRNGIIFPNILNLEFVFNDDSSTKYDFNRYLGVYVNAIELTKLDIDIDRAYLNRATWENIPVFRKRFLETDEVKLDQTNSNGVAVPIKNSTVNFSEFSSTFTDSDNLFINYISDKDGKLYMPKLSKPFDIEYGPVQSANLSLLEFEKVDSAAITVAGTGYSTLNNVTAVTLTGSGSGLVVNVTDDGLGGVGSITIENGGTNYAVGDTVMVNSGANDAVLTISAVSSGTQVNANLTSHGYENDDLIVISSSDPEYSGEFLITVIDADNFEYTVSSSPTSATATADVKKELSTAVFRFANKQIDLGLFFGQSRNNFLQDIGVASNIAGHSYISIKINDVLNNYDEIKIYHPNGTRTDVVGKHDLITSTQLYPLIPNPGEYYVYNDYDNVLGYDEFYMNGGGTTDQIASALAGCINGIRNRAFNAYAYDDRVFIKLIPAGDFDSQHKVSFYSPTLDYSVITLNETITGTGLVGTQTDFVGGTKEVGTRLIIDSGHLSKINQNFDSVLIKSSDSWSKIKKISPYIDEINEKNLSTPKLKEMALTSYDNKIAIVLAENETPTVSNKEFVMRLKHRPSFGLLSFYMIKDLDFDFYSSTYTNFPNIDLYQYYFIPEGLDILAPGIDYVVYNGTINTEGIDYPDGSFFTVSTTTSYSIISGTPIVVLDPNTSNATIPINDKNGELKGFEGFSILKDPAKIIPQEDSIEYNYRTKYLNGLTSTEYDYYKENDSLDFAVRSKIIPYITKWGIKNGKDTRDNPYRLNTELVFGRNNFSPDHEDRTQNPVNFTHEWFYIESNFNYVNSDVTRAQNMNYFEESLDETLLLSDPNYFINYFTYTPTSIAGKEIADTQFRYSTLSKNKAGQYEAFFRGFKITFKDVTDSTVLGTDGKPVAKDQTNRFDGYKFSCILKPIKEDINDPTQQPVKYKVIEHKGDGTTDGYKFIVIIIEIVIGSNDVIDSYWNDSLVFGGLVDSVNFNDNTIVPPKYLFETINGDYRIEFDANAVSNVTHTLLYSLKNKKYNAELNAFSNTRMASKLDIANGVNPVDRTIKKKDNEDTAIPNYPAILTDDLINLTSSTPIFIKDTFSGFDLFFDAINGLTPIDEPTYPTGIENTIDSVSEEFVHYSDLSLNGYGPVNTGLVLVNTSPVNLFGLLPAGISSLINQYYVFKVLTGGEKYFEKILQKISFARFKKYINEWSPTGIIEYYSYYTDSTGNTVPSTEPNFYLEIPDISTVEKSNQLITNYTSSIPTQFAGQNEIGVDYEVADLSVKYELNRYRGEYEPIVQNYSIYQSNYSFKKNSINDLTLSNTKINSDVSSLFKIQNFNHIKVADSQILELESDESYLPIYPKINEVAIGQAEYFLLRGNWDWGFHYKYSNKKDYLPVSGALRVEEDDSFIAKLINLPESIDLNDFKIESIDPSLEFKMVDISKIEIVTKETPLAVEGIINLNNVLTRYLMEDGISAKFNEYLINSNEFIGNFTSISDPDITVSSYVREYIKLNVLKLYEIEVNEFYVKPNAALVSGNTQAGANPNAIEFVFLNDSQRFTQGYNILKSLQINKKDKLILKFSFAKKPGSGLSISPKIKIKFI